MNSSAHLARNDHHAPQPHSSHAVDGCTHSRSHVADSQFHGHSYSSEQSREIFCDVCRMQRWLDVEAALASAQADLGLVPTDAAHEIAQGARFERLDAQAIASDIKRTGHSLVGLLDALGRQCSPEARDYINFGATTQDIQDTAQSLEMRDVLAAVESHVLHSLSQLYVLAAEHHATLMVARTHARPALPSTFGLKVAGWMDELLRHVQRIREARPRLLVAQLGGGVGTMASFGDRAVELLQRFSARLGLHAPSVAWHSARDRVFEFVSLTAMVAATCARIADEVRTLSRPEFGELREGWVQGQIGSSTMPHKRNPEACEQVVVLARLARALVAPALEAMVVEHERDARSLRLEWPVIADVSHYTLRCLEMVNEVIDSLQVEKEAMEQTARSLGDYLCSEQLMFALARMIGKPRAYEKVYTLTQRALSSSISLRELLIADEELGHFFTPAELERLLDPVTYTGASTQFVATVLYQTAKVLEMSDPPRYRSATSKSFVTPLPSSFVTPVPSR